MSREGDPASHHPAGGEDQERITLRACQERLRTAVRLLSAENPDLPPGAREQARAQVAEVLRELDAAERAYDNLLTNITHDVKTSLTVIRGHAQMVARAIRRGDAIDREALLKTIEVIDTSATRISTELDGWLDDAGPDPR